jgi:hypothetical protein
MGAEAEAGTGEGEAEVAEDIVGWRIWVDGGSFRKRRVESTKRGLND